MSDAIKLSGVTINAPDAIVLARFYAVITGGAAKGNSRRATVTGPNADIAFQQVDGFRPPIWPKGTVPMQMHLDFLVDDLALGRGSLRLQRLNDPGRWCKLEPSCASVGPPHRRSDPDTPA